jgi:hypothetical protein
VVTLTTMSAPISGVTPVRGSRSTEPPGSTAT